MAILVLLVAVVVIVFLLLVASVRRIGNHEYGMVSRTGRIRGGVQGPGVLFLLPFLDTLSRVDTRSQTLDVLLENVLSVDGYPMEVEATVHYKVFDPEKSVTEVEDYKLATEEVVRGFLHSLISQNRLDEISYERDRVAERRPAKCHRVAYRAVGR